MSPARSADTHGPADIAGRIAFLVPGPHSTRSRVGGGPENRSVPHVPRSQPGVAMDCPSSAPARVELRIVAENALLVEGNAPRRREVGGDSRALLLSAPQRQKPPITARQPFHRARECIAQSRNDLEH